MIFFLLQMKVKNVLVLFACLGLLFLLCVVHLWWSQQPGWDKSWLGRVSQFPAGEATDLTASDFNIGIGPFYFREKVKDNGLERKDKVTWK
jgi:hypothetical protein